MRARPFGAAVTDRHRTLDEIARDTGTDKSSLYHDYTAIYASYFEPMRDAEIRLVELGFYGGASAQLWSRYFPQAELSFIDVDPGAAAVVLPPRASLAILDQADPAGPSWVLDRSPELIDIIIDDASHLSSKTIASFHTWWPFLKNGGLYIVEDTHASYDADYYGPFEASWDPDASPVNAPGAPTLMQFFRRLTDELNKQTTGKDRIPRHHWVGYDLEWMHFYPDLIIIKKA